MCFGVFQGVRCHAWLYIPTLKTDTKSGDEHSAEAKPPAVVIMAHGIGGQKVRLDLRYTSMYY